MVGGTQRTRFGSLRSIFTIQELLTLDYHHIEASTSQLRNEVAKSAEAGLIDSPRKVGISQPDPSLSQRAHERHIKVAGTVHTPPVVHHSPALLPGVKEAALLPLVSPIAISKYKQDHTKLRIRQENVDSYVPKKLRSISTTDGFFASVASALNVLRGSIAQAVVVLDWMPEDDKNRQIAMTPGNEDCVEAMIEEIDDAPCWASGTGRCNIDVYVRFTNDQVS